MKKFWIMIYILLFSSIQADETVVILFTGLPSAGKTTIANAVHASIPNSVCLDGDVLRNTINKDLGFSKEDRAENLRRTVELVKLLKTSSSLILLSFVSPYESIREVMRTEVEQAGMKFIEVFVNASLDTCIRRDVKGMYKKAIAGEIPSFTGISAIYEPPSHPNLICNTEEETTDQSASKVIALLERPHPQTTHALFIGRWSPFHKGHLALMEKVYCENPKRPLLVLVRDNASEYWSAEFRKGMVEAALNKKQIPHTVMIIPDIDSVNWGRDVGYTPRLIDIDLKLQQTYSGTKIRKMIQNHDDSWREYVCEGADIYILEHINELISNN